MIGITVETNYVTIDLNGHELAQSRAFYLQNRLFMVLCLTNKAFLDGWGPTFSGVGHVSVSDVEIKNGVIGLSSHHGITLLFFYCVAFFIIFICLS